MGAGFDAADKKLIFLLPPIKPLMALVSAVHNAGLTFGEDLGSKRSFGAFAIGQVNLSGDGAVQVETEMHFGFLRPFSIVGPDHRRGGIDQRAVDPNQISKFCMRFG